MLWKKGDTILAVGKQLMVKDDPRVKLEESENGNTLVISLAEPTDAGEYLCQISAQNKPTELRHSVRVRGKKILKLILFFANAIIKKTFSKKASWNINRHRLKGHVLIFLFPRLSFLQNGPKRGA